VKQVTIHEAKTHLSRLIREALAGEEIVIARADTPLVRITPLEQKHGRRLGGMSDEILYVAEDFDAPLDDFADYS
jgi:prevent-host-death family protein